MRSRKTADGQREAAGMTRHNLRHLRVFLAVAETGSVTRAAELCHVSQPAVTQTLARIEALAGTQLFTRTPRGLFAAPAGTVLANRVRRALQLLDTALAGISPRLKVTATTGQLEALIAAHETENFTLAARQLGLAQPTVHRAVTQLEREAGRPLFERTAYGMIATRPAQALSQAARLAFSELAQADADLAELRSEEAGRLVIGAMPLSRSYLLPKALAAFRALRPNLPVQLLEGPYADLLASLRRGGTDMLIGALRDPLPIGDVEQQELFSDTLVIVCGKAHPLLAEPSPTLEQLADYPWVTARKDTPTRQHFDRLFQPLAQEKPLRIVESGSVILMRELLDVSEHLGCISRLQAEAEISRGLMRALPVDLAHTSRPIGITIRRGWLPTAAQQQFLDLLRGMAAFLPQETVNLNNTSLP
jgi:DNA-binding transcriptional LysR family regulator